MRYYKLHNRQGVRYLAMLKERIIAIGASTGGVEALEQIFAEFPANIPPVVVVIHMPVGFTKLFATRLDSAMTVTIKEASNGDVLQKGVVLIAPAGKHMRVVSKLGKYQVECFDGPKVQSVIPSADVLFQSIANEPGLKSVGVILTGLGADGAAGLLQMRNNGAETIGQDKATCAVYGMPKVAYERGAVTYQLPLNQIPEKILTLTAVTTRVHRREW